MKISDVIAHLFPNSNDGYKSINLCMTQSQYMFICIYGQRGPLCTLSSQLMPITSTTRIVMPNTVLWRHNGRDGVSNHQPHDCLLHRLLKRRSKTTSKLRVTGLCEGNSPGTGEFPTQMASNAENVSIWWRHHDTAERHVTMPCSFRHSS